MLFDQQSVEWWSSGKVSGPQVQSEIGGSQPSPQGPPAHLAFGPVKSRGPRNMLGLCPAGLLSLYQGCPLAGPRPWGSDEPTWPHNLMAAAICLGSHLWGTAPPFGQPKEPESQLLPGCLAPSAMTTWTGSGDLALKSCCEVCFFSQDLDVERKVEP